MGNRELARLTRRPTGPGVSFDTPVGTVHAFAAALNIGDLEAAIACFASDSCLVTPDATGVSGRGAIRGVLAQLIARTTKIAIESSSALFAGDVVFVNQQWRIRLGPSVETTYVQIVNPILVLRYEESAWKLAIAAPWSRR